MGNPKAEGSEIADVYTPEVKGGRVKNLNTHIRYIDES